MVVRIVGSLEARERRRRGQRIEQRWQRLEGKRGVAPVGPADRREPVILDRLYEGRVEGLDPAGRAEAAVRKVAACAAGNLRNLSGREHPHRAAVELLVGRERDMIQVQVEPHANGIRRDQAVHLARLVETDLCIAGARAERPQHHGAPAPQPADALGKRVDRLGREGDDGIPGLEPGQLAMPLVRERGKPGSAREPRLGHKRSDQGAHGVCTEEHGLRRAPGAQQAIGEDVAALAIACELNLVNRDELDLPVQRHRFDGADEIARLLGDPPFLARHQSDSALTLRLDHPIVDLAREEAEREAHHAGAVGQHALDRQMGFARVGRAEQRGDGGVFGVVPSHGGRIGARDRFSNPVHTPSHRRARG